MVRIVEGLSHSPFWPTMAIFVIEDDPQAGWDHVSGYRTTAFVASPYAKRAARISLQYNTTSVLRTMEQILGIPPMNQFDASASPMFECLTDTADLTPFVARPNEVPLDEAARRRTGSRGGERGRGRMARIEARTRPRGRVRHDQPPRVMRCRTRSRRAELD